MTDRGPFAMDHDPGNQKVERLARDLLAASRQVADRQFAHKKLEAAPIGGASVVERSVISIAAQGLWSAGIAAKLHPFNVIDGFAHGLAAVLAQQPPEARDAAMAVIFRNLEGYEQRTRAALTAPDRTPDA